jgi:formamidopyrimidine-DNA glycosylase
MPELPEVETVARALRPDLVGRRITGVWYDWAKVIKTPSAEVFADRVVGQQVRVVTRRAKYVVIHLEHDYLLVHLRMTGRLYVWPDANAGGDKWVHLRLTLDSDQSLCFSDARRFGRAYLTTDLQSVLGDLGPEPLADDFSAADFAARVGSRGRAIKPLLLDQSVLAGVGNIYADEALYRAQIHPLHKANTLSAPQLEGLYHAVRAVLQQGIDHEGSSINWYRKPDGERGEAQDYFNAYGRDGQPCRRCGTIISKIRVGQRGTHFCPACQVEPVA